MRPMVVGNQEQKIAEDFARTQPLDEFFDHRVLVLRRDRGARQKRPQLRRLRVGRSEIVELLGRRLGRALRERDIRQRVRILEARGFQLGLPSRLFTKLLISDSCALGVSCFVRSDSALSTASVAAKAFSSRRAARSAASISAFAAVAIFCASLSVAARSRATSAADSRSARARSSVISFWRFTSLPSASRSCASAAALAAVDFAIAELIAEARPLKNAGAFFRHSQRTTPATIAKLIHLKSSVAFSTAGFSCSSAACTPTAAKSTMNRTPAASNARRFRVIEPLSWERPMEAFVKCGAQFRRKVGPQ